MPPATAAKGAKHRPRLFLIDSYGFIFRAYHARARSGAPPMRTTTGLSTEAVYIFHNMVRKLRATYQPEYIAAIFESGKTFREEAFAEYKANRTEMPPDLGEQIPYIRRMLEAMRIPVLRIPGFRSRRRDRRDGAARERRIRRGDRVERQGHAAAGGRSRAHVQPGEGRRLVRSGDRRRVHGREARAGGRSAGAEGRLGRQHSGRAGHRRQRRARFDPALRVGGRRARARRAKWSARRIAKACRTIASRSC